MDICLKLYTRTYNLKRKMKLRWLLSLSANHSSLSLYCTVTPSSKQKNEVEVAYAWTCYSQVLKCANYASIYSSSFDRAVPSNKYNLVEKESGVLICFLGPIMYPYPECHRYSYVETKSIPFFLCRTSNNLDSLNRSMKIRVI